MFGIAFLAGLLLFQGSNEAMASGEISVGATTNVFFGGSW
jgi:hypothetical protein